MSIYVTQNGNRIEVHSSEGGRLILTIGEAQSFRDSVVTAFSPATMDVEQHRTPKRISINGRSISILPEDSDELIFDLDTLLHKSRMVKSVDIADDWINEGF